MEEKKIYFVTSIYLNAYLLTKGFSIVKTSKLDNGKVAIFYTDTEDLHNAIEEYKSSKFKEFVSNYLRVKSIISSFKGGVTDTTI